MKNKLAIAAILVLLITLALWAQTVRPTYISQIQFTELTTAQEGTMTLVKGNVWFNTDLNCIRLRLSASSVCILEGGGTSDAVIKTPTADQRIAGNFNLFAAKFHNARYVDPSGEFTTIQAAIDDVASTAGSVEGLGTGGGTVFVPCGTFQENLTTKSQILLFGSGPCTIIKATANSQTLIATVVYSYRLGIANLALDAANFTGVIGIDFNSVQLSFIEHLWIVNQGGGISGTAIRFRTTDNGLGDSADNTTSNTVNDVFIARFDTGILFDGDGTCPPQTSTGGYVTLSEFSDIHITSVNTGIDIVKNADTNNFHNIRIGLTSGGTAVDIGSGTPGSNVCTPNNHWSGHLAVDGSGSATGVKLNATSQNTVIDHFFSSMPPPATNIDVGTSGSYRILDCSSTQGFSCTLKQNVGQKNQSIEKVSNLYERNAVTFSHTGTTAETDLRTTTISGGFLSSTGCVEVEAWGGIVGTAGTKVIRLKWGGDVQVAASLAAGSTEVWRIQATICNASTSAQHSYSQAFEGVTLDDSQSLSPTKDTTADVIVKVTGALGNAADTISITGWLVTAIP